MTFSTAAVVKNRVTEDAKNISYMIKKKALGNALLSLGNNARK
jgi:hypothetical protein